MSAGKPATLACLKLPITFEPEALQSDLDRIQSGEWVRHFNDRYYEGDWSGVALRALGGSSSQIYSDPQQNEPLTDTAVLSRCPSIQQALAAFECPVKSARLLKLGPAARILEHRDYNLSLEDGEVRLHVPITTDARVEFFLNGERVLMLAGECWYINANLPHKVENRGEANRVHLVVDCVVDDWLRSLVASASSRIESPIERAKDSINASSPEALQEFCSLVFADIALQERLRQVADKELFIDLVVRLGEESGCSFNADDVKDALREKRQAWIGRWV